MKSSKIQAPSSREPSSPKQQTRIAARRITITRHGSLKFGASLALGSWCLGFLLSPNVHAQSYSLDWSTIDGGGGTSTGGGYYVSGNHRPSPRSARRP